MEKLLAYEEKQIVQIKKWKKEKPGLFGAVFGRASNRFSNKIISYLPQKETEKALDFANVMAKKLSDQEDILTFGGVKQISELRDKSLRLSDWLANQVHNWAIGMAAAEGAVTGAAGLITIPFDIPVIITLALRTAYQIGLCYGYDCESEPDKNFILGILSASGANSMKEKTAALDALQAIEVAVAKQTWRAMAKEQLGKESVIVAVRSLARQLGVNITRRRMLSAIPAVGAVIGGSVNAWYMKDVGWAARRSFQERWLISNGKIVD